NKNDPLTFANKVWGNTPSTAAQEQWRTVLGTKYQPFAEFMDVLAQAGKSNAYNAGSRTQPLLKADEILSGGAKGQSADALAVSDLLKPLSGLGKIKRGLQRAMQDPEAEAKFLNDFADILTGPEGRKLLTDLKSAKTGIARTRALNAFQKSIAGTPLAEDAGEKLKSLKSKKPEPSSKE
ncbi:hypothetical protein, partial [Methylobacterium sp. 1030]|uniref:hypothetical protein n=1 Tax=Methylobacterium sp. 1030 TaxID=3156404 RepID=UPI0033964DB3